MAAGIELKRHGADLLGLCPFHDDREPSRWRICRAAGSRIRTCSRTSGWALQKLGVIRDSGHEHFNGSVVVPIIDPQGTVLGMYGRKITAMAAAAMTITVPGKPERMAVRTFGSPPKFRSQNCAVAYTSVATK